MTPVLADLVARAVSIVGRDGISDAEIEAEMLSLAQDSLLARRLVDWPPEAFGLVLVPHLARVVLPTTFSAKSKSGAWSEFPFSAEPVFEISARIGAEMYHSGPKSIFNNVVARSSIFGTVNQALRAGQPLDGGTLSGPALVGIPAEAYFQRRKTLWERLFH